MSSLIMAYYICCQKRCSDSSADSLYASITLCCKTRLGLYQISRDKRRSLTGYIKKVCWTYLNLKVYNLLERWPSGLRPRSRKAVSCQKRDRGFKSHPLRQTIIPHNPITTETPSPDKDFGFLFPLSPSKIYWYPVIFDGMDNFCYRRYRYS